MDRQTGRTKPRALICYSNPAGTGRLRLDVEHAQIESALASAGLDVGLVKRIHATRLEDVIDELGSAEYEVLQFSGHGDEVGIFLENSTRTGAQLVDAASLGKLLLIKRQQLRVVVLTCCFSDAYREELAACVPYLISVQGPAPDKAAIEFARLFYSQLWRTGQPIELAFKYAEVLAQRSGLSVHISRRGLVRDDADFRIEAQVGDGSTIIVDLTSVRGVVDRMSPHERERFLRAICTNIEAHRRLFTVPMERVAIPFGEYVGIFSWQNEIDPVRCERLLSVRSDVSESTFEAVARLMARYATLASAPYRGRAERVYPGQAAATRRQLDEFHGTAAVFFDGEYGPALRSLTANGVKIAVGIIKANLGEADLALGQDDVSQAIVHLETALTTLHNLVMQVLDSVEA